VYVAARLVNRAGKKVLQGQRSGVWGFQAESKSSHRFCGEVGRRLSDYF